LDVSEAHDVSDVTSFSLEGSRAVEDDLARTGIAGDGVGLEAISVCHIAAQDALVRYEPAFVHQVGGDVRLPSYFRLPSVIVARESLILQTDLHTRNHQRTGTGAAFNSSNARSFRLGITRRPARSLVVWVLILGINPRARRSRNRLRTHDHLTDAARTLGEGRRESVEESENVVADQHLAIAVRSGADAMVGIFSCEVTASATVSGIASSTIANAPASSRGERVEISLWAADSLRPAGAFRQGDARAEE